MPANSLKEVIESFLPEMPDSSKAMPRVLLMGGFDLTNSATQLKKVLLKYSKSYGFTWCYPQRLDSLFELTPTQLSNLFTDDYPRNVLALLARHLFESMIKTPTPTNSHCLVWQGISKAHRFERDFMINLMHFLLAAEGGKSFKIILIEDTVQNDFIRQVRGELYEMNPSFLPLEMNAESMPELLTISDAQPIPSNSKIPWQQQSRDNSSLLKQSKVLTYLIAQETLAQSLLQQKQLTCVSTEDQSDIIDLLALLIRVREFKLACKLSDQLLHYLAQENHQAHFERQLLYQAARGYRYQGELARAKELVAQAQAIRGEESDPSTMREIVSLDLTLDLLQGHPQLPEKIAENADLKGRPIHPSDVQLKILRGHGFVTAGNPIAAAYEYRHAQRLAEKLNYKIGQANAMQSLAICTHAPGKLAECSEMIGLAETLYQECGHPIGVISCRMNRAEFCSDHLHLGEALTHWRNCEGDWQRWHERNSLCESMLSVGKILHLIGYRYEALSKLRFAGWLAQENKMIGLAHKAALAVGLCEGHDQKLTDAKLSLEKAQQLGRSSEKLNKRIELTLSLLNALQSTKSAGNELQEIVRAPFLTAAEQIELLAIALGSLTPVSVGKDIITTLDKLSISQLPLKRFLALRTLARVNPSYRQEFDNLVQSTAKTLPGPMRDRFMNYCESKLQSNQPFGTDKITKKSSMDHQSAPAVIHTSKVMSNLLAEIKKIAVTNVSVLIEGESGTGKELIAREIHRLSSRNSGPMISVACAAIDENLFESQFFGFTKGSFTGAHDDHAGFFETAFGGTLFLDNIDELSLANQSKLLRVLQEGEIRRLGSIDMISTDVRVIAAATKSLQTLVDSRQFRLDLFYRLAITTLYVPALRERREDIMPLIDHVIKQKGGAKLIFDEQAQAALMKYSWPGNIRELIHEIERIMATDPTENQVTKSDLSLRILSGREISKPVLSLLCDLVYQEGYIKMQAMVESAVLQELMRKTAGNVRQLSKLVGLPHSTLRSRLDKVSSGKDED